MDSYYSEPQPLMDDSPYLAYPSSLTSPSSSTSTSPSFPATPPPHQLLYQDPAFSHEYIDSGYTMAGTGLTSLATPLNFDYTFDQKLHAQSQLISPYFEIPPASVAPQSAPPQTTTFDHPAILQPPIKIVATESKVTKRKKSTSTRKSSTGGAPPGPIPATTPTLVKRDENGVEWISFEYSKERVKTKYFIRCDIESVQTETLVKSFRDENCIYPRACVPPEQYTGNRQKYETECNRIGWSLSFLNPELRAQRGLIQRAVDSWRNTNADPSFRSRRVKRLSKKNSVAASPPTPKRPSSSEFITRSASTPAAFNTGYAPVAPIQPIALAQPLEYFSAFNNPFASATSASPHPMVSPASQVPLAPTDIAAGQPISPRQEQPPY